MRFLLGNKINIKIKGSYRTQQVLLRIRSEISQNFYFKETGKRIDCDSALATKEGHRTIQD